MIIIMSLISLIAVMVVGMCMVRQAEAEKVKHEELLREARMVKLTPAELRESLECLEADMDEVRKAMNRFSSAYYDLG